MPIFGSKLKQRCPAQYCPSPEITAENMLEQVLKNYSVWEVHHTDRMKIQLFFLLTTHFILLDCFNNKV